MEAQRTRRKDRGRWIFAAGAYAAIMESPPYLIGSNFDGPGPYWLLAAILAPTGAGLICGAWNAAGWRKVASCTSGSVVIGALVSYVGSCFAWNGACWDLPFYGLSLLVTVPLALGVAALARVAMRPW